MKQHKGFSVAGVVIGLIALAILVGATIFLITKQNERDAEFRDYAYTIMEPSADNGEIGDHVKGPTDAPIIIFEYADFQCPMCASMNPRVNAAVEEADGKLAVVYRNYLLSYHDNATAAASAAEAAGLQGYWKAYADKLFSAQSDWYYASGSERTTLFNDYFKEVTDGKGDIEKFNQDIASENISKKISFDMSIGKRVDLPGTPAFYVDGQFIDWSNAEGSKVTIDGHEVSWDHSVTGEDFTKLLLEIANAKNSD